LDSDQLTHKEYNRLRVYINGDLLETRAVNEVLCAVPLIYQTSHIEVSVHKTKSYVAGNGVLIATFEGSTAFYQSAQGIPFENNQIGLVNLLPYRVDGPLAQHHIQPQGEMFTLEPIRLGHQLIFDGDSQRVYKLNQHDRVEITSLPEDNLKVVCLV
jgi:NAD kinase